MAASKVYWSLAAFILPALFAGGFLVTNRVPPVRGVPGDTIALAVMAERDCASTDSSRACYERRLTELVGSRGVKVAMGTLNRLAMGDDRIRREGHVLSHAVGIAAGKGRSDVSQQFSECTEILQSGCYHGVIQGYFESASGVDSSSVNGLCSSYGFRENQWLRFQCVHGLGHGVTMFYAHHLPRALAACDLLVDGWDRDSCYGGAFMENVMGAVAPHHPATRLAAGRDSAKAGGHDHGGGHAHHGSAASSSAASPSAAVSSADTFGVWTPLDSTNMQYPCSAMPRRYLRECYVMQTSVMLHFRNDVGFAAQHCAQAPDVYRYICHQSLGRDISARAQSNARKAIALCARAEDEFEPWCHFGVVKDFIGISAHAQAGIEYCAAVTGQRNKMLCYFAAGEQIAALNPSQERRGVECVTSEEAYREACLYGAGIGPAPPTGFPRPRT